MKRCSAALLRSRFEELHAGKGTEPSANLRVDAGPFGGWKVAAEEQQRKMFLGPVTKNGQTLAWGFPARPRGAQLRTIAVPGCGIHSSPSRKLPVLCGYFHFFAFFDEQGNADLQTRLQSGGLGHRATRRVASNPGLRGSDIQLHEYW